LRVLVNFAHTLEDFIKNIKKWTDVLRRIISKYMSVSKKSMQRVHVYFYCIVQ
ncbi:uncharacterized protein EV154DRAFT_385891, partial [Mucor mucedo]|uniref:uncharacterized protein n=1 Tax=Mucor mucedo TaxID=29922 RepID=UPI002220C44E